MKTYFRVLVLVTSLFLPHVVEAKAAEIQVPPVPDDIQVDPAFTPFLIGHAIGTQGYVCVAVGTAFSWAPFGPQATLFDVDYQQTLTHYLSITPYSQVLNPAWQYSRDSSVVWGQMYKMSSDPHFVAPDAIPWLLLEAAVVGEGPTGGDKMLLTRFIHRVNTVGGKAPTTGCIQPEQVKTRALVPYEADYIFYRKKPIGHDRE
jgi:hypothetical protein